MSHPEREAYYAKRAARISEMIAAQGFFEVPKYTEGAERWCSGCACIAERGADSYGDCADCGEELHWVVS